MKKYLTSIFLCIILCVGFALRYHNLNVWPREGATFDEYAWTFLGLSLWDKGIPTSWSPHAAYTNRLIYFNPHGARFTLVTPYLEHPPLFGLVAGGFARLNSVNTFDQVTIAKIRPLALALGVLSIFSVYLLASVLYGEGIGLIAAGIYAIIPTVAVGSRIVQNENFFIPLFLLSLYYAYKYLTQSVRRDLIITAILCGLLPLAKIPWLAAPLAVTAIFAVYGKWKPALLTILVTAFSLFMYYIYGTFYDSTVFFNLLKLQVARYDMAFDSIFVLFRDPLTADRTLVDGWIYIGWAVMFLSLCKDFKKNAVLAIGFLSYFLVFAFAVPGEPLHGWYRYPFYPFLAISIALFLKEYLNKNFLASSIFFMITGLSMLAGSWAQVLGFSYPVFRTYIIMVAVGALPGIFPKLKKYKIFHVFNILILCIVIVLSMWTIYLYNEQ